MVVDEDDANIQEAVVDLYVPFIGFLAIANRWLAAKSTSEWKRRASFVFTQSLMAVQTDSAGR